ncbi:HET-domain-containing protein [Melanomma pulvis-pyrius CBS 109.77]|uniref:HET-domain-containing protein n=1 Tax=Melanomma pulvis-pyrius CBS 109.77 TaxID=1314802 RepID=A0A6A6X9L1_9PLEO|nr:HET-domain-containing protein [Melanomma pulvis-pyrius CBS 109.77]
MPITDADLSAFLSSIEGSSGFQQLTDDSVTEELLTAQADYVNGLPDFRYRSLRDGEIRVITFEQGGDEDGPIRLRIHHVRTSQCKEEDGKASDGIMSYSALSYVWGTGEKKTPIVINNCSFAVTSELNNALLHLRNYTTVNSALSKSFWIDAMCINQQDAREKSIQVALMKSIYETAFQVIVWLGEETPNMTKIVFSTLENNIVLDPSNEAIDYELLHRITPQQWFMLGLDIMRRPWWRRMWVIQEIAVAKRALVMCGPHVADWKKLESAGIWAQMLNTLAYFHTEEETARGDVYLPNVRFKRLYRIKIQTSRPMLLLELLQNNVSCKATDARDMIFSLVGIASDVEAVGLQEERVDPNSKRQLICDYNQSPEQIYTDLVHVHASTHNSLNILAFNSHPKDLALPSWVPDWTSVWKTCPFILAPVEYIDPVGPTRYIYNASAGLDLDFTFVGNDKVHAIGIHFDTLRSLAEPFLDCHPPGETFYRTLMAWRDLALGEASEHEDEAYIASGVKSLAFRRSITADQTKYGARVEPDTCSFDPLMCFDPATNSFNEFHRHMMHDSSEHFRDSERAVYLRISRRAFFVTEKGYFGIGPPGGRDGDCVCLLGGCSVPLVLRKVREEWEVVGECFVCGIMDGEVAQMGEKSEVFVLR